MKPHCLPYYAVIFTSTRTAIEDGYKETALHMEKLAKQVEGYLGMETARDEINITVSYWESLDSISNWKNQIDHLKAQQLGKKKWYQSYTIRITKVEREYSFEEKNLV